MSKVKEQYLCTREKVCFFDYDVIILSNNKPDRKIEHYSGDLLEVD